MSKKQSINIKVQDIQANPEDVFEGKVTPSGNGAVIPFFKKFVGKMVYIIVRRK